MDKKVKVNASILIIGNEILSGRTQDTNTSTLAIWLNSIGVNVAEVRVIPDVEETIVETLNLLRSTYDYVFTTGGIGPTHDDITAQSVSKAFGIKYEIHKEAFKILEAYYQPGEFNKGRQKMTWMPSKANLILNPTSGAPGFNVENVFCLPGVPSILKSMLGGIKDKISGNTWETSIETISQPPTKKTLNTKTLIGSSDSSDIGKGKYTGPNENKYSLIQGISLETDRTFNGLIYIPTETPKSQVVLHHTANNSSIASLKMIFFVFTFQMFSYRRVFF